MEVAAMVRVAAQTVAAVAERGTVAEEEAMEVAVAVLVANVRAEAVVVVVVVMGMVAAAVAMEAIGGLRLVGLKQAGKRVKEALPEAVAAVAVAATEAAGMAAADEAPAEAVMPEKAEPMAAVEGALEEEVTVLLVAYRVVALGPLMAAGPMALVEAA